MYDWTPFRIFFPVYANSNSDTLRDLKMSTNDKEITAGMIACPLRNIKFSDGSYHVKGKNYVVKATEVAYYNLEENKLLYTFYK